MPAAGATAGDVPGQRRALPLLLQRKQVLQPVRRRRMRRPTDALAGFVAKFQAFRGLAKPEPVFQTGETGPERAALLIFLKA